MPTPLRRSTTRAGALAAGAALLACLLPSGPPAGATTSPQTLTGLVSASTAGAPSKSGAGDPQPSTGGRFVVFSSSSADMVAGDTNGKNDIFVRDTLAEVTRRASLSTSGAQTDGNSYNPSISANGRWVAFMSKATNLVPGDTNGHDDAFLHDMVTGKTTRVSVKTGGGQVNGDSAFPVVSDTGNQVVFRTDATDIDPSDTNGVTDVYLRDVSAGSTERITVTSAEVGLTKGGTDPDVSGNGRYVVFSSTTTQVGTDTNGEQDVFIRDRVNGTTVLVSYADDETQGNDTSQFPTVSADGRYVAFQSDATDLVTGDTNAIRDAFVRDRTAGTTTRISVSSAEVQGTKGGGSPTISDDGTKVGFGSDSANLVAGDTNGSSDAFVRDMTAGTTTRVSVTTNGAEIHGITFAAVISPDGATSAFETLAGDVVAGDLNGTFDAFWRGTFEIGPHANSLALLQQNSKDFTGTTLSIGDVVALNNKVLTGVASPESLIDDWAHGTYDDDRGMVMRLYWSYFHRIPDQGGLDYWVGQHHFGRTLRSISAYFAKSPEFIATYGALDDTAFTKLVYGNVFNREPDASGLAYWVGQLHDGLTRGGLLVGFSESAEGRSLMRGEVDTILLFQGMLHTLPTQIQFDYAVSILEAPAGGEATEVLVRLLLRSPAYATRVAGL